MNSCFFHDFKNVKINIKMSLKIWETTILVLHFKAKAAWFFLPEKI